MSLAEKAKARKLAPKRNPIDVWLETLEPSERDAALHMLNTPHLWPQSAIITDFADEGFHVGKETVGAWRRANSVSR
ncbi:hypothetical protein [Leifsonia sp. Root227]|uniref:hypothetical protein n=1 Tax=Leifsonia sp. Root227 TaxID=1736496 RepID=UPI0012FC8276|nr:hypothetical protein [Leifsonia sp. Root227]